MATAFLTGGSGFIGGRLIEHLVADGEGVKALARSERSAERVRALGAEPVIGDLTDGAATFDGARGCDIAFHLAAKAADWGPWEEFLHDNVEGTRSVLEACAAAGVPRFVHAGTEAALMAGDPLVDVDKSAPLRPDSKAPYPRSKAMAEELVVAASREGFETVVLRPRFVWGAGDTNLLPAILGLVRSGRFAWLGGGRQLTDTTHVDNVVHGMRLAGDKGRAGEAYFVTDGDPVVFRDFVSEMIASRGVEPPDRSLPQPVAHALMSGGEALWRLLPLGGQPPLTRFAYWASSQQCTIETSKARRELGYEPVRGREDGLAELREAGAALTAPAG